MCRLIKTTSPKLLLVEHLLAKRPRVAVNVVEGLSGNMEHMPHPNSLHALHLKLSPCAAVVRASRKYVVLLLVTEERRRE